MSDLHLFLDCFSRNDSSRSLELLEWQYFQPPSGKLFVEFALTPMPEQRLAAIYATFPVTMRVMGESVLGVQSLNTLTDQDFRGKGLFLKLAKTLYERCANDGVKLIYGFPNGNSAHGFFHRLEWRSLDPMPLMLRPLRSTYLLKKILRNDMIAKIFDFPLTLGRSPKLKKNQSIRTITAFGSEIDEIWQTFSRNINFTIERNTSYLQWRLGRPEENYESFAVFENEHIIGFAIIGVSNLESGNLVGKLMEIVFDPLDTKTGAALMTEAIRRLTTRGCGAIWAWNFKHSPNHAIFRKAGFISISMKHNPSELHAGARPFTEMPTIGNRNEWYVSLLDSDTH